MKYLGLLLVLLLPCVSIAGKPEEKPPTPADAYKLVKDAPAYSIGGVGVAGTISQSEKGYRVVLAEPDASARFSKLLAEATPAGQLYALLGLKEKDPDAFKAALAKLENSKEEVTVTAGCMVSKQIMGSVAKRIAADKE